jgi:cytochrome d ubiquinol oxidase subunit II
MATLLARNQGSAPYLFVFTGIGIVAAILLRASLQRRTDQAPFRHRRHHLRRRLRHARSHVLAVHDSFLVEDAAAPHSSLAFMFWGAGLFVFPLMLLYTATNYSVFRGRIRPDADHYH